MTIASHEMDATARLVGFIRSLDTPFHWTIVGVILALLYQIWRSISATAGSSCTQPASPTTSNQSAAVQAHAQPVSEEAYPRPQQIPPGLLHRLENDVRPLPRKVLKKRDLARFTGSSADTPIYIAIRSLIYDVSKGRAFYGPEGPYACFAGRDATVALAKGRLDAADGGALTESEMQNLERWEEKLGAKYEIVGVLDTEE